MMLVDTSVWSLALRRDSVEASREVDLLKKSLNAGEDVFTTGLILQELLQGVVGPKQREKIVSDFSAFPLIVPTRLDHIDAAALRNRCRQAGVQVATIDAIIAQLAIRHDLALLTTDKDFTRVAAHSRLKLA